MPTNTKKEDNPMKDIETTPNGGKGALTNN